uniref:Uncharacterized protein n=1 Tax=Anopheles coluzzii TaxID=1518534 RepID=A0A8W7PAD5_ANOCL
LSGIVLVIEADVSAAKWRSIRLSFVSCCFCSATIDRSFSSRVCRIVLVSIFSCHSHASRSRSSAMNCSSSLRLASFRSTTFWKYLYSSVRISSSDSLFNRAISICSPFSRCRLSSVSMLFRPQISSFFISIAASIASIASSHSTSLRSSSNDGILSSRSFRSSWHRCSTRWSRVRRRLRISHRSDSFSALFLFTYFFKLLDFSFSTCSMCEMRSFMLRILLLLSVSSCSGPPLPPCRTAFASRCATSSSFSSDSFRSSSFFSRRCSTSSCFCESLIDCCSFFFLWPDSPAMNPIDSRSFSRCSSCDVWLFSRLMSSLFAPCTTALRSCFFAFSYSASSLCFFLLNRDLATERVSLFSIRSAMYFCFSAIVRRISSICACSDSIPVWQMRRLLPSVSSRLSSAVGAAGRVLSPFSGNISVSSVLLFTVSLSKIDFLRAGLWNLFSSVRVGTVCSFCSCPSAPSSAPALPPTPPPPTAGPVGCVLKNSSYFSMISVFVFSWNVFM